MGVQAHLMDDERVGRVLLNGDLDISKRETVSAALPPPDSVDLVVFDCSTVTSIDSAIVTIFMRYRRAFVEAGRDAHNLIVVASPQVRRIFDIVGISKAVTVIPAPSEPQEKEGRA